MCFQSYLKCTKCFNRDGNSPAPKLQEKTVLGWGETQKAMPRIRSGQGPHCWPQGKVFSQAQFLHETKLTIPIKRHSVSFSVPLCLVRFIHPLDLRSNTTSSRKFPLTLPASSGSSCSRPGVRVLPGTTSHLNFTFMCLISTLLHTTVYTPWWQRTGGTWLVLLSVSHRK